MKYNIIHREFINLSTYMQMSKSFLLIYKNEWMKITQMNRRTDERERETLAPFSFLFCSVLVYHLRRTCMLRGKACADHRSSVRERPLPLISRQVVHAPRAYLQYLTLGTRTRTHTGILIRLLKVLTSNNLQSRPFLVFHMFLSNSNLSFDVTYG